MSLDQAALTAALAKGQKGINDLLDKLLAKGEVKEPAYKDAKANAPKNLEKWLLDPDLDRLSPFAKEGLVNAIHKGEWTNLLNAFARDVKFGTGGIREKMGFDRNALLMLKNEGIFAPFLRGPNMINDLVLLLKSEGMAQYAVANQLTKCVIGFDSRVQGKALAQHLASLFLNKGLTVFLFDEANMYPEVTYAVPKVRADFGIFISASHNDFRYNGYKVSCGNGSQFNETQRKEIYNKYMANVWFNQIHLTPLKEAPKGQLIWLGGNPTDKKFDSGPLAGLPKGSPLPEVDYAGHEDYILDMHSLHVNHCKEFLLQPEMIRKQGKGKKALKIAYCAYHGAGRKAAPRLLEETGFGAPTRVKALDALDGLFPCFCSDPGKEQQPDPGDYRAADVAIDELKKQGDSWKKFDLMIGTDPDSDRCGVTVQVPTKQLAAYSKRIGDKRKRNHLLLPADEAWTLLLWYQLRYELKKYGTIRDVDKKFIVLSHVTTDTLTRVARLHGLGVLKTWVGFAMLARAVDMMWNGETLPLLYEGKVQPGDSECNRVLYEHEGMYAGRVINVGAYEQSNGFSMLGSKPPDAYSLGVGGHTRDKDGALAAVLLAEIAAWAKSEGASLLEILDEEIYSHPAIGLFANYYEPDPLDGEYPGLKGDAHKQSILLKAEELLAGVQQGQSLKLGGLKVSAAVKYLAGKYQAPTNWDGFPDEGLRFYFGQQGDDRMSHLTMRPSGTSNAMRFHVQLHEHVAKASKLVKHKGELYELARDVVHDFRKLVGAEVNA